MTNRHFVAFEVPRFIRTMRLGYVPMDNLLGSRSVGDGANSTIIYDFVMLPEAEFVRARMNAGVQHVVTPAPHKGETLPVGFIPTNVKHVVAPDNAPDPKGFAKGYFMKEYGLEPHKSA